MKMECHFIGEKKTDSIKYTVFSNFVLSNATSVIFFSFKTDRLRGGGYEHVESLQLKINSQA